VFTLGSGLAFIQPCAAGGFGDTGSLATARRSHTATLLPGGMVLVVGGLDNTSNSLASAELYDPTSGTWTATGSLAIARDYHTATLLPNGMVLVAGGTNQTTGSLASAELYDPTSGTWTATGGLATAREFHTATSLPDGSVMVAGGFNDNTGYLASAEIYDPTSGTWTATDNLANTRQFHTATPLPNGTVLVAGGLGINGYLASAEIYDPASGTWTTTGSLGTARDLHTATLLPNGEVLVAGGGNSFDSFLVSAERYDSASGTWTTAGSLTTERASHSATLTQSGMALVVGGDSFSGALASAELYDPANGTWTSAASLTTGRQRHTATLLPSGAVLVAGGQDNNSNVLASAELYSPSAPVITSPLAATTTVGVPFSYQFEATGATSLDVDFNTLPDGLFFDPALSAIVGNSKVDGTFQVALSATNASGTTNATLVLTVQLLPAAGPIINSVTSATGRTSSPFYFQVTTTGGSLLTRLTATGLPNGLSVDQMTGIISGTATTDGSIAVALTAADSGLTNTATLQLTFTSDLTVPVIVSPENAFVFTGVPFSSAIMAPTSDTLDPVTYSAIGQLPAGLGLNQETGVISGTPQNLLGLQPAPQLAGGVISNVQGFACNSSGCGTQSLFFLKPTGAANISTRLSVGTADNVLIGGFITQGDPTTTPMRLMVRGIGPSLPSTVAGPLADPYVELHSGASIIAANDNWMDDLGGGSQKDAIENATYPPGLLAPTSNLESAILAVLNPGAYTAVLHGANNGTGVGLVEIFKLGAASVDALPTAILANISTRGNVQTGDNVMIGGFINQGSVPIQVLVRGIGPSLTSLGVNGALANPILELHGPDGTVKTNDDWMATQKDDITATTLAPTSALESAILLTLPVGEGAYTAIVRGVNNTTGVALVEAYFGNPCLGTSCP
jgi:hypothetical protein